MKKYFFYITSVLFLTLNASAFEQSAPVRVQDQDAVLLFRYVAGAGVSLTEDTKNEILHSEVMTCSMYFDAGTGPKYARCMLPYEQVWVEKDNAVEVMTILKNYNMPSDRRFGYESVQAGLDCTKDLSGDEYPICFLTPKAFE